MKQFLLQIGKHSSIYMIAQVVANGLSVLMFPIYVHYFTPAEFGAMALIDVTVNLMIAVLAYGILAALARHHFESETVEQTRKVWWTGFLFIVCSVAVGAATLGALAAPLAQLRLGDEVSQGALWIRLAAVSLMIDIQNTVIVYYLRAKKRSTTVLMQSVVRSVIFVACALPGIVVWELGLTAMFLANIISSGTLLIVQYGTVLREWGRPTFSRAILRDLWRYGWPLFLLGGLMTLMSQMNLWFLTSLKDVGLLSLGLQVTDKVNRLIVMPFQQIWSTLIYELHTEHRAQAVRTFCFIFEAFCYVLISVFFACSIAAGPALMLVARPEYLPSVPLIPILCLAQFCMAISDQFQVPMRLSMRTYLILPSAIAGVTVAVVCNWWLVPIYGGYGSAWSTVATYAAFSGVNLLISRQIDAHPYPFGRIATMLAGVCSTYFVCQTLAAQFDSQWASLGIGMTAWLVWTLVMAAICWRVSSRHAS